MATDLTLGTHTYAVVPQPIGWLESQLGEKFSELGALADAVAGDSILSALGTQAHSVLRVFIPELMPEHEFRGYASREAFEARSYDRSADNSPNVEQIAEAFQAVLKVNGDLGTRLGKLLGPDLIRAVIKMQISQQLSGDSPSLPQANGASVPTSSGNGAPTPPISSSPGSSPTSSEYDPTATG